MPEKKKFTARSIAGAIEREIVEEAVAEGVRLPSAAKLASRYGVSVKTADRALNRLAEKGFVSRVRGGGNFVRANRGKEDQVHVGITWCGIIDSIASLETNPTNVFMEELCRLLTEHKIDFRIFFDRFGPVESLGARLKKFDVIVIPAGLRRFDSKTLENAAAKVILYGDDSPAPGPWHQVVYDYRPGMTAALAWFKARKWRKFFLPGWESVTVRSRQRSLIECGLKLGFREEDFRICYTENAVQGSSVMVGSRCAETFIEEKLFDHVIFSVSDFFTYGMFDVFRRRGLVYGKDFQLVSYDNFQSYLGMPVESLDVTAVTHPLAAHARAVVDMIEDVTRKNENGYFRTYTTPATEFVVREHPQEKENCK